MKTLALTSDIPHFCKKREEGQALVLTCIGLMLMLLMAGLGVDVGYLRYQKHQMQKAADSGALAAAQAMIDGNDWRQAGVQDASVNGFADGTNETTVIVNSPPVVSPAFAGLSGYVEVIVSQPRPNFFMKLLGSATTNVSSRAVASINGSASGCIIALDPRSDRTLLLSGTPEVSATCGVYVRSTNSDALHINGNGTLNAGTAGGGIGVVGPEGGGGWSPSDGAGYNPTPVNIPPFKDPLIHLAPPDFSSLPCLHYTGQTNPEAGKYCGGIDITGNQPVTFQPGTYILYGGGLRIRGSGTVSGTGVFFYNTGTSAGPLKYAPISINSGLTVTLSAPTSGTYQGILFFQDRAYTCPANGSCNNDSSSFGGGNNETLTGALYFPGTDVNYAGNPNATVASLIVAWRITFDGTTQLNNHLLVGGGSPIQTAALSE
jgi:putative Flp pilus-assembly TadE/G-like protein